MIKDTHKLFIMIFFFILSFIIMAIVPLPVVWLWLGFSLDGVGGSFVCLAGIILTLLSVMGILYVVFPEFGVSDNDPKKEKDKQEPENEKIKIKKNQT